MIDFHIRNARRQETEQQVLHRKAMWCLRDAKTTLRQTRHRKAVDAKIRDAAKSRAKSAIKVIYARKLVA